MTNLELLACQMAQTWHEMNRMNDVIAADSTTHTERVFTEDRVEKLSLMMDDYTTKVFAEIQIIANQPN